MTAKKNDAKTTDKPTKEESENMDRVQDTKGMEAAKHQHDATERGQETQSAGTQKNSPSSPTAKKEGQFGPDAVVDGDKDAK